MRFIEASAFFGVRLRLSTFFRGIVGMKLDIRIIEEELGKIVKVE